MNLQQVTFKAQSQLAEYCRTGNYSSISGVNEKHIHRYRNLIYGVVEESLQSAYPLTKNLLEEDEWIQLVDNFFSSHHCQSPQIWQMPGELFEYLENNQHSLLKKYPILKDLILFEWLEIEIYMMEDIPSPSHSHSLFGNEKKNKIILNQELKILMLNYPVHLKNAKEITEADRGQFFVCLHRDPESGNVEFSNLNYPHVELIEQLANEPTNYRKLRQIFLKYLSEDQADHELNTFIKASLKSKLILGYEPSSSPS